MARIKIDRDIAAPKTAVWQALADLGSHDNWMKDAESIVFVTDQQSGIGTKMRVKTVVGPFRTMDEMEVVGWEEGSSIEVEHRGLVTGRGTLAVSGDESSSRVTWDEVLTFPWWLGGPVTAWFARPVLRQIWKGNLARLDEGLTGP